jgi:hypothetical protein
MVYTPIQHKASSRYWTGLLIKIVNRLFGQLPHRGAFSTLYAATEPSLTGGWAVKHPGSTAVL